jgi:hypothetical protein
MKIFQVENPTMDEGTKENFPLLVCGANETLRDKLAGL